MSDSVLLKPKRDKSARRKHPWIFSGAIREIVGKPGLGSTVAVYSHDGDFIAWGHYSPHSQIRVRLISWDENDNCDSPAFYRDKILRAVNARRTLLTDGQTTAYRLVNAENDLLPGLIIDKYDKVIVIQSLSAGIEIRKEMLTELVWNIVKPRSIYERSDVDVRQKEGLSPQTGLLMGELTQGPIEILENGLKFLVDVTQGHKSGFYLDQRQNRLLLQQLVQKMVHNGLHPRLLNVFSYTGGFTVYGLQGGVENALNIDSSKEACQLGRQILNLNDLQQSRVSDMVIDAFKGLRLLRQQGQLFDIIVLDPPKFAAAQRDIQKASRGYKDINLQAMHLLAPGGFLLTFSCSGVISDDLFQKIVFGAAVDANRHFQIVGTMTQSDDHPVALTFPEGAYLKGLVCRCT
jgi:23S rRNA (cytosine1962-C5)-methyltransferase